MGGFIGLLHGGFLGLLVVLTLYVLGLLRRYRD